MTFDLRGKTALITGAGSGIGHAFAKALLQKGCNVLIADLALKPEAEKTIKKYTTGTPRAIFLKIDVTDWIQLQTAFDKAIIEFSSLDIVCPAAGIFDPPSSSFWHFPSPVDTSSYKTLDVNLYHPIRATQLAFDSFLRQKHSHGVVLHITSNVGQVPAPAIALYATSKAGLSHFVRSMGLLEGSLGVRVLAVAPGVTDTGIWDVNERRGFIDERRGE